MKQKKSRQILITIILIVFCTQSCIAFKGLVNDAKEFILTHPFVRQVRYYQEGPFYRPKPVPKIEYSKSAPLLIGNFAEPIYRAPSTVQFSTGYEQGFEPSGYGYQVDGPQAGKFYEDSYLPRDAYYGPPKIEAKPEPSTEPTTTMMPVATPCTCLGIIPSQPLAEGAPQDMYLPPEMTLPSVTNPPEPVPKTEEPEAPGTTVPETTIASPSDMYLPVDVEPRIKNPAPPVYTYLPSIYGIQGPTPIPQDINQGYVYVKANPVFEPETTPAQPETTTAAPTTTTVATTEKQDLKPNLVPGYQPIFLIPLLPAQAGGFQYYGALLPQQIPGINPPIVQNGGQEVVISSPSKVYLPPQ